MLNSDRSFKESSFRWDKKPLTFSSAQEQLAAVRKRKRKRAGVRLEEAMLAGGRRSGLPVYKAAVGIR